ncbi:hypothetical protein GCM10009682_03630 [Luedemannella flava]|uniref:Glucanase n=1 Tax=Luedemannella flava TaxID=349316 RepID=A0ABP4XJ10_9ACTN
MTNLSFPKCAEAQSTGAYMAGVAYALEQLHSVSNVYTYVDMAHSGWLGWDSNLNPTVQLFTDLATQAGGFAAIDGFISNTANTTPTIEPYMTATQMVGGNPVRSAKYYQWNQYIDEQSYALAMRTALIAKGYPTTLGVLIDTSRNGWGGSARPTGPSTSTSLETFVDETRIDRRFHRGNWCNPSGAGLGERPKPDGASTDIPNDGGKKFDRMCDPTYTGNALNGNSPTGAQPDAPLSGQWFATQFAQLVQNAYPPVS